MYERRKHAQADLNSIQPSHIFQTAMKKIRFVMGCGRIDHPQVGMGSAYQSSRYK